jgi:phycocyanobilin lyase beta subunit
MGTNLKTTIGKNLEMNTGASMGANTGINTGTHTGVDLDTIDRYIQAVQNADSAGKLVQAVAQLAACRHPKAIPPLIEVLGFNNPGAAVAAVDGLVALGDEAAQALLQDLDDYNYTARAWALRALALLGEPAALEQLQTTAATDFSLSVRRAAAKGLGNIQWHKLPPEKRLEAQHSALKTLKAMQSDPEWVVRYASLAGLATLAQQAVSTEILTAIGEHLRAVAAVEPDTVVQARCLWALDALPLDASPLDYR